MFLNFYAGSGNQGNQGDETSTQVNVTNQEVQHNPPQSVGVTEDGKRQCSIS